MYACLCVCVSVHVQGYNRSQCYIAAQGPLPNTLNDFWRMVWERKLNNIVMLTKCIEAGRVRPNLYSMKIAKYPYGIWLL